MIIVQTKYNSFPPKKNTKSDQTFFLILKGKLLILTFNNKGKIVSSNILSKIIVSL